VSERLSPVESVAAATPNAVARDADILLSRLQVASLSLARADGEREIVDSLGRGALGLLDADGVIVGDPQLDRGTIRVLVHHARGVDAEESTVPAGDNILMQVARSGEHVLIVDADERSDLLHPVVDPARGGVARSLACAPLTHGRRLYGVVAVYAARPYAFDERDLDVLRTFGALAATLLSNTRLYTESERERRQSDALAEIARAVGESLRMGEVLRLILRHSMSLLGVEGAYVALARDEYLHIVSSLGAGELLNGLHLPVRTTLDGKAVREGTAIIANEARAHPGAYRPAYEVTTIEKLLVVPLVTARGTIGVLTVFNRDAEFTDDDARILRRLADQVAVAIVNARLFEEITEASREWTATFDAIGCGMVVVDDAGCIMRYNSRAVQLAGLEGPRELVGQSFYEAILHERREGDEKAPLQRVAREGRLVRATLSSSTRGRVFDITAAPHPNGGAIVTFDDISATRAFSERNRLVVESAVDALLIADPDGVITFANVAAVELLGREELVGMLISDLVIPETSDEVKSHIQIATMAAVGGTGSTAAASQRREYLVVRGDGERRVAAVSLAPLREGDRTTGVVVAMRDVTEERRARDAVSQTEARYRNLFDTVNDALFTLDARGAVTSANQAACQILDASREELLGRSIVPFLDSDDVDRVTAYARDALAGVVRRFECRAARRSGLRRVLSVTMTPLRQGRVVIGALCVARDVTDERNRANAVAEVEARLEQLVEITSDGICTVDEEGNFTSVNAAFERATGRTRDALIGDHFTVFIDPRDRDQVWGIFVGALHGVRQRGDIRYVSANGEARWGHVIAAPVFIQGRVAGALAVVRDVTEERQLRERLNLLERDRGAAVSPVAVQQIEEPEAGTAISLAVLVVDDEPAIRTAVSRYLSSLGHQVDVAASGREALDHLSSRSFDLILLDLRMPDMAGDALYRELIARDAAHAGRIVFITGEDASSPATQSFLQASGRPVIGKPFSLDDLRRALALATL